MVHFVGAGSGAVDLITVRGKGLLEEADVIIYAGSLVNPELLSYARKDCEIHNSAKMTLEEVISVIQKAEAAGNNKMEYENTKQAFMDGFNTLDVFQDGWVQDAYNNGYSVGEGIADKFGGYFDNAFDYVASDIGDISDDTGSIADSVSATEDEIKYLREIAERDVINRFTTAEIKVDMSGMSNNITNGLDIDGVIDHMAAGASEALEIAAEGVHR